MIESIVKGFRAITKKPVVLVPALLFAAVTLVIVMFLQDPIIDFIVDGLIAGNLPTGSLIEFPLRLFAMYPAGLMAIAAMAFVSTILWIANAFVYARIANDLESGNASLSKAFDAVLANKARIFWLGVFFSIIVMFFGVLVWLLLVIGSMGQALGIAALVVEVLLLAGLAYIYVKLAFVIQAMAVSGLKPKEALVKSWNFTVGRFWHAILFLFTVTVVAQLIWLAGDVVEFYSPSVELGAVAFLLFWTIGVSFSNMAIAFYFIKKELGKSG